MLFYFRLIIGMCLLCLVFSNQVYAQFPEENESQSPQFEVLDDNPIRVARELKRFSRALTYNTEQYEETLKKIYAKPFNAKEHVRRLRPQYASSVYYEPFADSITDRLMNYAYIIDTSYDRQEATQAQSDYNALLRDHLGNLGVINFALDMSRLDVRFGNEVLLRSLRLGYKEILNEMIEKKHGYNPNGAFQIMTYAEEDYILGQIGGVVETSEIYKASDRIFYNVHDLKDPNGEYKQFFFNVTLPIYNKELLNVYNEQKIKENIPVQ